MQNTVIIGVNILETLTTGMYYDSRVIFREYIQNSCDQIDVAVRSKLLAQNEGQVDIWIDEDQRSISIEDNATGISETEFKHTLYNIGDSQKTLGEDKGFRGIGHWCGLGYCKTLIFTTKAKGENVESVMTCDAEKMRQMLIDHNTRVKRYSIDDVLTATINFSINSNKNTNDHYFKVDMLGITDTNDHLLNRLELKNYLSFVAPVPYANSFYNFCKEIYAHAEKLNVRLDEYRVTVDAEPIEKKYTKHFETSKGTDEISRIEFIDFYDDNGTLIAWMWYGLSKFIARIDEDCIMRDIRLRKDNIQIGDSTALKNISRRGDKIGTNYTIGEIFAISKLLIPTSQRDYFEDNKERKILEKNLRDFFTGTLYDLYNEGSKINSAFDKIEKYDQMEVDFQQKENNGQFTDRTQRDNEFEKLQEAKSKSDEATQRIDKLRDKLSNESHAKKIIDEREQMRKRTIKKNNKKIKDTIHDGKTKPVYVIDTQLSHYSKQERKLIEAIFSIITASVDSKTAEMLKERIVEELK